MFIFEVLTTKLSLSIKSFLLCLYIKKSILAKQMNLLRLVCTTWQTWNSCKTLNLAQSTILMWGFRYSKLRSFVNSLIGKEHGTSSWYFSISKMALLPCQQQDFPELLESRLSGTAGLLSIQCNLAGFDHVFFSDFYVCGLYEACFSFFMKSYQKQSIFNHQF